MWPCSPHTVSDADLGLLVRHLRVSGAGLAWRDSDRSLTGRANRVRFSHVTVERSAAVRAAYAAVLRERVRRDAPPVLVSPPAGGPRACLLCGQGAVQVPAVAADVPVWFRRALTPSSLGGRGPAAIEGWVCPSCDAAIEAEGAVGPTALVNALTRSLDPALAQRVRQADAEGALRGLVGWAVTGQPPNERPWQHADLSGLE